MKTGFWLRGGNGKLAGATVYQQNGETVMREVVTPANPKTNAQLLQRIIMHTIMSSYSKMKAITDHSFEGIKKGSDSMAFYIKQNVQFARQKVAEQQEAGVEAYDMYNYTPLGVRGFTPNQYLIAMGSLPQIESYLEVNQGVGKGYLAGFAENTYENVIQTLGLKRGDQLTFCLIKQIGGADQFGANEFNFCRVILDPTDPVTHLPAPLSTAFIVDGAINYPSIRNEGSFVFAFNASNQITFTQEAGANNGAVAVIASRLNSDGTWMRSTTYLKYQPNAGKVYSLGECLDMAKNGTSTPIYSANEQYLNNAGTGNGNENAIGGDASNEPQITAASVHGMSIISGTARNVEFPNGTAMPQNVEVEVTVANAFEGAKAYVLDGSTIVKEAAIVDGTATLSDVSVTTGKTYKIGVDLSDEEYVANDAYAFTVSVNAQGGGGGDAPLDEG